MCVCVCVGVSFCFTHTHARTHTHTHTPTHTPTQTHTYTDVSKADNLVAAAYTIPTLNLNKHFRLCDSCSIYAAELAAIKEVFSRISENENQDLKNFEIFSDSLSVLMSIKHSFSESRPTTRPYYKKQYKHLIKSE